MRPYPPPFFRSRTLVADCVFDVATATYYCSNADSRCFYFVAIWFESTMQLCNVLPFDVETAPTTNNCFSFLVFCEAARHWGAVAKLRLLHYCAFLLLAARVGRTVCYLYCFNPIKVHSHTFISFPFLVELLSMHREPLQILFACMKLSANNTTPWGLHLLFHYNRAPSTATCSYWRASLSCSLLLYFWSGVFVISWEQLVTIKINYLSVTCWWESNCFEEENS